ncbi:hypothetical protein C0993_006045, partial [Termitomyces sp. T159_Od127]
MSTTQKYEPSSKRQRILQWMRSVTPKGRTSLGTQVSASTASSPVPLLENLSGSSHMNNPEHVSLNQVASIPDSTGAVPTRLPPLVAQANAASGLTADDAPQLTGSLIPNNNNSNIITSISPAIASTNMRDTIGSTAVAQMEVVTTHIEAIEGNISDSSQATISLSAANAKRVHLNKTKLKDGFKTVWQGLQFLSNKVEPILDGTPFQIPFNIFNTLVELEN